jgi:large subunit ribosomal protein LP0
MVGGGERKQEYFQRLVKLLEDYPKIFIVGADNVGSNHMQRIRMALRGKAVVLMGKNTMIRKAIRGHMQNNPSLEALLPIVKGNVGFVFIEKSADLSAIQKLIEDNKVAAPAKAGAIAPCDVIVPAGNTGLEPTQTSFLQALNIPSKISRGQIEIIQDIPLIKEGNKVGASEANLLAKLSIKPFQYGLALKSVYDNGALYDPKFLKMKDEDILAKFQRGVTNVASISLAIGYPTLASLPHSIIRGYKNLLSIAVATSYSFKQAEKVKAYLANPSAFAAAAPAPKAEAPKGKAAPPPKEEKKPVEEEKEEDEEIGGLFGFDE